MPSYESSKSAEAILEQREARSRSPGSNNERRRRTARSSSRDLSSSSNRGNNRKNRSSSSSSTHQKTISKSSSSRRGTTTRTSRGRSSSDRRRNSPSSSRIRDKEYTRSPKLSKNEEEDDASDSSSSSSSRSLSSIGKSSGDDDGGDDDDDRAGNDIDPDVLKTPGSAYSRSSRRLGVSAFRGTSPHTPSQTPGGASASSRVLRRRIKYQPPSTPSLSSSQQRTTQRNSRKKVSNEGMGTHSDHSTSKPSSTKDANNMGFEVMNTSGNISTWEMRQRFQREFPNDPVPSDVILRQLYRGEKIAEYERKERYKLEFPGEPVPSDEVLKKLYAVDATPVSGTTTTTTNTMASTTPVADQASLSSTPSVETEAVLAAKAQPLQRELLLSRQHSESNMTFATEVGWDDYGGSKSSKKLHNISSGPSPSGGMGALVEGDEEECTRGEPNVDITWQETSNFDNSMHFPISKSPVDSMNFAKGNETWAHSYHGMTSLPESNGDIASMEWANTLVECPSAIKPSSLNTRNSDSNVHDEPERPKSSSSLERIRKSPSSNRRAIKASSGHSLGKSNSSDALQAFNESFGSLNSFENEKSPVKKDPKSIMTTTGKSSSSKVKSKSSSKKKERSSSKSKSSKLNKRSDPKRTKKKKPAKTGDNQDTSQVELCLTKSPSSEKKSWWNLRAVEEKSPSNRMAVRSSPIKLATNSPSPSTHSSKKQEAWQKREAWKKSARTRSAPLAPVNLLSEDLERSFSGDPFAAGVQMDSVEKSKRRGRKTSTDDTAIAKEGTDLDAFGVSASTKVAPSRGVGRCRSGNLPANTNWHPTTDDPFQSLTNERSTRQSRRTLDGVDESLCHCKNNNGFDLSFSGSGFDASTARPPKKQNRAPPGRAKSAELPNTDTFGTFLFDVVPEDTAVQAPPPAAAVLAPPPSDTAIDVTGALQPSKRDFRRSKSSDRPRPSSTRKMQQQRSNTAVDGWGMGISGALKPVNNNNIDGNDDDDSASNEFELHVEREGDEPLSPLTIATKKPIHRPIISRRRGYR